VHHLQGKRVIMVLGPGYQDEEGSKPLDFLRGAGARVDVVGLEKGALKGLHGRASIDVDMTPAEADLSVYDAMVIPGGRSPANLRKHAEVVDLVKRFYLSGRTVAAICHGPQLLAEAGLVEGRNITGYYKIKEEMIAAGVKWHDRPVVIEDNLITSRQPSDIKEFNRAIEEALTNERVP
jgi:protease I